MRRDGKLWLIAALLCIWPMAANADEGEAAKLVSECGAADLPQGSLDSCLERVRVLEETDPSPQLQTLEASLEQRESGRPVRARAAAAAARVVEVAPGPNMRADEDSGREQSSPPPATRESSAPRSGASLEDEPPVSDAPDAPAGTDRTDEDTSAPPQS